MQPVANHQEPYDGVHLITFNVERESRAGQQAISAFFGHDFLHCTAGGHAVVVDLSTVDTLDSASLGPLVQRLRELQERRGRLILCGLRSPALREIFALTRFDQIFEIVDTVEQALGKLGAASDPDASADDDDDWPG